MKNKEKNAVIDKERREFYRLDDELVLKVDKISDAQQLQETIRTFKKDRNKFSLLNSFSFQDEGFLPKRRLIESNYPEIADYLRYIDKKISILSQVILAKDESMPAYPTHTVNLSAKGMRFKTDVGLKKSESIVIKLQLFPSFSRIYIIGVVVWSNYTGSSAPPYEVAVDFSHIDEADREVIIKHLHDKLLDTLQQSQK